MSHHQLLQRTESEVTWCQRRSFLQAAALWTAASGYARSQTNYRSNIVELRGDALVNGQRLRLEQGIQSGDSLVTGPGSTLMFVVGNAAFHMRQNSQLTVERGNTLSAISVLRLLSGAVVSVFGRGRQRSIQTPTMTAGIRGTGVYTEVFPAEDNRSYFCNCYGTVDVVAGGEKTVSQADYHQSFWAEGAPKNGRLLSPAKAINHTDEELEILAALIDQRTTWQIKGQKGVKNGMGQLTESSGSIHPAENITSY